MNEYTASNTATVQRFTESLEVKLARSETWLEPWTVKALREFFRAEEDERLERWRWPENPDYVVYAADKDNVHMVVQESTGLSLMATRTGVHVFKDLHADAARAYFAARPEPKLILLQAQDVADVWVTLNEYRPEQRAHAEQTARLLQSQDVPARVTEAEPA